MLCSAWFSIEIIFYVISSLNLFDCCNVLWRSPLRTEFSGILHISHRFNKFRSATIIRENNKKLFCGRIRDTFFTAFLNFETKRLYNIIWKITRAQRKTSLKLISCNSKVKPKSKISCNLKFWVFQDLLLKLRQSEA